MIKISPRVRQLGQGMTEYIIIVALIAIAAIGMYKAFGGVVRGQTAAAASSLAGDTPKQGRTLVTESQATVVKETKEKTLQNFEN